MRAASCHLTPVTLELGGKSPALVEGSCDITATARRLVWARFFNAGQSCVAPDYVLCSPETRRLLLPALRDCITQLYGTEPRESRDFGRIINQRHFERIRDLLSNSQGRVEIGGETEEGESGVGRYHGRFSFDTFSHQRSCVLRGFGLEWANQLRYPPYSEQKLERLLQATQERKWSCTLL
ncbi:Aldehyde dehydrogenase family 3 member B1 [Acipenser ruthenus]|uniref:Aldehyde dehydrogenase family 3 member B1 n=1 Tax=Acipenser ruthenus TaxID=7906 RepID=A0A444USQ5_ACIRT|nr:Aldehyde dehydrogenase family 3 member B1 [Acipenser ruthenus]